ncbi:MAG: Mrp/NBP35 family ATP-binding protein [Gammaproteobacteria bacterium]
MAEQFRHPGIKQVIAIASGKGGVGKSTTAVNLALALVGIGYRVGLLDADIHGPNQPHMLGTMNQQPATDASQKLYPVERYGLQTMSIAYLIDAETPVIWRGPMVGSALQQLFYDTQWQDLDYLIIDLPPGTGDVQLTLAQKIPLAGAVIVTTPQDVALLDVRKAIAMFNKVKVPILGVVENMALHTCSQCGHQEAIFGEQGAKTLAQEFGITLLGSLPLNKIIREHVDQGKPTVVADPDSALTQNYLDMARSVVSNVEEVVKRAKRFPKIVVE